MGDSQLDVAQVRGSLPSARANARTVAALTANPGCTRRRVLDAASVATWTLVEQLGHQSTRGQSPFAIVTGDRFEYRLKKGSNYQLLVDALSKYVSLPKEDLKVLDLNITKGVAPGEPRLRQRALETEKALRAIATGSPDAPHLMDHPVLIFSLAGTPVFLEPDGLACRVDGELELIEIKSYAIIDDQADPSKLSSTAGQAAVYLLALRATLERLGLSPKIIKPSVILVAPRNFGRTPTAHRIPLRKKIMALGRVLQSVPNTDSVLSTLPADFTLDVDPKLHFQEADRREALTGAIQQIPMLYVPECLNQCDMAQFCRHQAVTAHDPAFLGRSARDGLSGVGSLEQALSLARGEIEQIPPGLEDAAKGLQQAYGAILRARAQITPRPTPKPRRRLKGDGKGATQ